MKTYLYVGLINKGGRNTASTQFMSGYRPDWDTPGPNVDLTRYPILMFKRVTYHHLRHLQGSSQLATNQARDECCGVIEWNLQDECWEAKMKNGDTCIDITPAEFFQRGYELIVEKDYAVPKVSQDHWCYRYYDDDRDEYYRWCNSED